MRAGRPTEQDSATESLSGNIHSAGELVSGIAQDVSRLVRLEIELAKQEIAEMARTKALAAGMGVLGVVLALMLIPFVLLTIFELFDVWMPRWTAALLVTVLIAAACGAVLLFARKQLTGTLAPERTVRSIKESVAWAKRLKR